MLSYSRSLTYAPMSAIYRFTLSGIFQDECDGVGEVAVAWHGGPTCLTFTMTKLSTSGYFSSARNVRRPSIRQALQYRIGLTVESTVGQRHCGGWSSESVVRVESR